MDRKEQLRKRYDCDCTPTHPCPPAICAAFDHYWQLRRPQWRVTTFLSAVWRYIIHGLPRAAPEVVEYRWLTCQPCENRDQETNKCGRCGCGVSDDKRMVLNKITWATEFCPDGKWSAAEGEKIWSRIWRWLTRNG